MDQAIRRLTGFGRASQTLFKHSRVFELVQCTTTRLCTRVVLNSATHTPLRASLSIPKLNLLQSRDSCFCTEGEHSQTALTVHHLKYAYLDRLHGLVNLDKLHVDLAPEPR